MTRETVYRNHPIFLDEYFDYDNTLCAQYCVELDREWSFDSRLSEIKRRIDEWEESLI